MSSAPPRLLVVEDALSSEHGHTARNLGVVGILREPVPTGELAEARLERA